MEGKSTRDLVVMVVVFGMVAGQITGSSFQSCYGECFLLCAIMPNHSMLSCSLECLKDCIIHSPSDLHYYCNLGCASSLCTNISTQQNPGGEEVEGCVNSCSQICTQHH